MSKNTFKLHSEYQPAGDQPKAIKSLMDGLKKGLDKQTLLGVTGSGKTFTVANIIANFGKPTLVIAHNKTLAAQLAQEYREFFPDNAVHYFVSYYDYYQPEAYMPASDTYIEKEAMINDEIDRLRHASTQALLTRKDVIIVASVSCIYGLGSPKEYEKSHKRIEVGQSFSRDIFIRELVGMFYERTNADLAPGMFRAIGTTLEIMPVNERFIYRLGITNGKIETIDIIDAISRTILEEIKEFFLFPAKHFITETEQQKRALKSIKFELDKRLAVLKNAGKLLEADRLKRRTEYDLALIREVGYCNGIENYSRHFSGKAPGEPPDTLLAYFPHTKDGKPDFLTIIDESHVTVSQIGAMHGGDASRKENLVEHGFRLPSAKDNRPLTAEEFEERVGQTIYTSATPAVYEREVSKNIAEQIIRPTGLIDPEVIVVPVTEGEIPQSTSPTANAGADITYPGQVKHFIDEAEKVIAGGGRVIATTLTKKMAEDLSEFLKDKNIKAEYIHSDIKTMERIEILTNFRKGEFDCIVGVNLLREGLDLPEVEMIGILDADKEGFLRSETSLIQIIGRAARNVKGRVFLYADQITRSLEAAMGETNRRRTIQVAYNTKHGITPQTIKKQIKDIRDQMQSEHEKSVGALLAIDVPMMGDKPAKLIREKEKQMNEAVKVLDFETAAILRDEVEALNQLVSKSKGEKVSKKKSPRRTRR